VLLLALLTVFLTTSASAQALGLERKIVVFQRGFPSIPQQAAVISAAGGLPNKPLPLINAYAAALPGPAVKALLHRPEVRRIDDDIEVHALPATDVVIDAKGTGKPPASQPPQSICWGLAHVFYPETYPFATWGFVNGGYGVKVAILDTGIDLTHPDLKANIKGGVNTISPKKSPNDDNGHGTHVAGIVAALDNSIGVVGVAPRAFLYAVKALNSQGTGYLSDIIEACSGASPTASRSSTCPWGPARMCSPFTMRSRPPTRPASLRSPLRATPAVRLSTRRPTRRSSQSPPSPMIPTGLETQRTTQSLLGAVGAKSIWLRRATTFIPHTKAARTQQ